MYIVMRVVYYKTPQTNKIDDMIEGPGPSHLMNLLWSRLHLH